QRESQSKKRNTDRLAHGRLLSLCLCVSVVNYSLDHLKGISRSMLTKDRKTPASSASSSLRDAILYHAKCSVSAPEPELTPTEHFTAVARAVRDRLVEVMHDTEERYRKADAKRLYCLSMEFLIGRSLRNNLFNLGIHDTCRDTLREMSVDLKALEEIEPDAALGNGGLGRLAACFLDSLATLGMPGFGY